MDEVLLLPPPSESPPPLPVPYSAGLPVRETVIPKPVEVAPRASLTHYLLLLLITLLGGVLRFMYLDRPAIWGDEAQTYGRVCGTFEGLLGRLQDAGFGPLHYLFYWWMKEPHHPRTFILELLPHSFRGWLVAEHKYAPFVGWLVHARPFPTFIDWLTEAHALTPFMLRVLPAAAGTLMVPAMYWLAVQLAGRRVALLTALLSATSAYLLNYSRDGKMYSHFWLFVVLNVASLLWWLRVRTRISWCVWVTTGALMLGIQAVGWIVVVIELLMVLTTRRPHWLSLVWLLIFTLASVIVGGLCILPIVVLIHLRNGAQYERGEIILMCAVVAMGLLNLVRAIARLIVWVHAPRENAAAQAFLFWSAERAYARPLASWFRQFHWPPLPLFIVGLLLMGAGPYGYYHDFNRYLDQLDNRAWSATGIQWVEAYNYGRTGPMLAGYTATAFLDNWEWPRLYDEQFILPRTLRLLEGGTLAIVAVMAIGLLPWWRRKDDPPLPHRGWRSGLWMLTWIALPAYGFYCVSMPNFEGPVEWLSMTDLVNGWAKSKHHAQDIHTWLSSLWAQMQPHWMVGVIAGSLGFWLMGWFIVCGRTWKTRFARAGFAVGIVGLVMLLILTISLVYPIVDKQLSETSRGWAQHKSVWMPRYLGVVFPPFLIITAILLARVPTRPLRYLAVGVFVIVNLAQHGARIFAGSEPPTGLMAQDLLASQVLNNPTTRTYFATSLDGNTAGEPGSISMYAPSMRYYEAILSGKKEPTWEGMVFSRRDDSLAIYPSRSNWLSFSSYIISDARRNPSLKRIVTWEENLPRTVDLSDKVLDGLEPQWKLESDEQFMTRDHWRWKDLYQLRRRVYVRVVAPSTQP